MLAIGAIGPLEIGLIVLVILLLFGAKRLPELARGLGKGIREFRGAVSETSEQLKSGMNDVTGESARDKSADSKSPDSDSTNSKTGDMN